MNERKITVTRNDVYRVDLACDGWVELRLDGVIPRDLSDSDRAFLDDLAGRMHGVEETSE